MSIIISVLYSRLYRLIMNSGKNITEFLNKSAVCTISAEMYRISAVLHPRLFED